MDEKLKLINLLTDKNTRCIEVIQKFVCLMSEILEKMPILFRLKFSDKVNNLTDEVMKITSDTSEEMSLEKLITDVQVSL